MSRRVRMATAVVAVVAAAVVVVAWTLAWTLVWRTAGDNERSRRQFLVVRHAAKPAALRKALGRKGARPMCLSWPLGAADV